MFGKEEFRDINSLLNKSFSKKKTLICHHRGAHNGNIVQNSLNAFKVSFLLNADMVEFDLSKSVDNVLYSFHDTTEIVNLGIKRNIETFSSKAIEEFEYLNSLYEPSGQKVETFSEILEKIEDNRLFNVDRGWNHLKESFALLNKYPKRIHQALLKVPAKEEFLNAFNEEKSKFMLMVIVRNIDDVHLALSYKHINLVGLECIIKSEEDVFFSDDFITSMHTKGLFLFVNALTLSSASKHIMSAGYDDNKSLIEGFSKGWGVLLNKRYDIIQTDWPSLLNQYINERRS